MTDVSDRAEVTAPAAPPGPPPRVRVHRPVAGPLVEPAPKTGLGEVLSHRYLLRMLVKRETNARYQESFLGLIWSYINPLSQLFIYAVIMGILVGLGKGLPNFAIHVFAGLCIVQFFSECFGSGTRSIVRNKALVKKMAVPREMFPVASMITSFFHTVPQIIVLTISCVIVGWHPDATAILAGLLGLSIIAVFGLALALAFALANVYFRDVGSLVGILTNFVRFSVPMIYPYTKVASRTDGHVGAYLVNPVANAVLLFQRCFWIPTFKPGVGKQFNLTDAAYRAEQLPSHLFARGFVALGAGFILLLVAQIIFSRLDNRIPERLT